MKKAKINLFIRTNLDFDINREEHFFYIYLTCGQKPKHDATKEKPIIYL